MDVLVEVQEIVSNIMGHEPEEVKPESHFVDDLSVDSLDAIEIIMDVEDMFNIEICDEEMDSIHTVQEMVDCINKKI